MKRQQRCVLSSHTHPRQSGALAPNRQDVFQITSQSKGDQFPQNGADRDMGRRTRVWNSITRMAIGSTVRRCRWVWLLLVIIDVLNGPRVIRPMVEESRKNRWLIGPMLLALGFAAVLNWWWFQIWWKSRPSKTPSTSERGSEAIRELKADS